MSELRLAFCMLAAIAVVATGCATASLGSSQTLQVSSTPERAECEITRGGQSLGKLKTPGSLEISRSRQPITIACTKEGYEEARAVINSETRQTPLVGPGLIGGVMAASAIVDMSSGADTRYRPVTLTLLPLSSADKEVTAARQTAPASASAQPKPSESWRGFAAFAAAQTGSTCVRDRTIYTFELAGDVLTVDSNNGRLFTVVVPATGAIDQTFTSPTGAALEMVGDARMRNLEVVDTATACRWHVLARPAKA
jgi:hypothetical protein